MQFSKEIKNWICVASKKEWLFLKLPCTGDTFTYVFWWKLFLEVFSSLFSETMLGLHGPLQDSSHLSLNKDYFFLNNILFFSGLMGLKVACIKLNTNIITEIQVQRRWLQPPLTSHQKHAGKSLALQSLQKLCKVGACHVALENPFQSMLYPLRRPEQMVFISLTAGTTNNSWSGDHSCHGHVSLEAIIQIWGSIVHILYFMIFQSYTLIEQQHQTNQQPHPKTGSMKKVSFLIR